MNTHHKAIEKKEPPKPAVDVMEARIAAMRSPWGTLNNFFRSRGYAPCTAWYAMQGKVRGPRSLLIVEDVKREFGV